MGHSDRVAVTSRGAHAHTRTTSRVPSTGAGASPEESSGSSSAWVGTALEAALLARAPGVHASTPLVRRLAARVSRELGLDAETEALLDLCVQVRDVGMLALPDSVVLATTRLSVADWQLVNRHPVIGAELLETLSVVRPAADIVRGHHERWDGDGYPDGRRGGSIPLLSRVIAICDAFVAIASDRPHRRGMGAEAALGQIRRERGSQFDPDIVAAFVAALDGDRVSPPTAPEANGATVMTFARPADRVPRENLGGPRRDLMSVVAEFHVVAAFAPACERALAITADPEPRLGDLVAAIESDTGLTIAVLRKAQGVSGRRPIANVADAVSALSPTEIADSISALPRAEFPWRTSQLEVLLQHSRAHAQAVSRAADRIAREVPNIQRDDVLVAALLHDIGKLVLHRVSPDYLRAIDVRTTIPENRIRQEQRALGMDHASLGGLLLRRWGLPSRLADTVAAHHTAEHESEVATYVRLADMVAHHAQGDMVDRPKMLHLCQICGLSAKSLRDILFDLPHSGEASAGEQNRHRCPRARPRRCASSPKGRCTRSSRPSSEWPPAPCGPTCTTRTSSSLSTIGRKRCCGRRRWAGFELDEHAEALRRSPRMACALLLGPRDADTSMTAARCTSPRATQRL